MRRGRRRRPGVFKKSAARQPAPANGIAAGRFGATWWGREWMAALERLGRAYANRLPRGRSYAREGRVIELEVTAGHVTAGVVGSRPQPYRVDIGLAAFPLGRWLKAVEHLAGDALLVARLLGRELPTEAADTLKATGIELFPSKRRPLDTRCSCPDVANPCKHVAAVHYVFAAALDNDPFLLLRLAGLDRDRLVAALGAPAPGEVLDLSPEEDEPAAAGAAAAPPAAPAPTMSAAEFLGHDRPLPVFDVAPRGPEVELIGLKRLGPAPRGLEKLGDALAPFVRAAGKVALDLAWWQPGDAAPDAKLAATLEALAKLGLPPNTPPPAKAPRPAPTPPPVDPMLARVESALGEAGEPISKRELVKRVGEDAKQVDEALQKLRKARLVVASGRGAGTRYALAPQKAPRSWKRRRRPRSKGGGGPSPMPTRILELLGATDVAMTVRDLATRLDTTPDRLGREIAALRRSGVVEMVGRRRVARYRLKR